MSENQKNLEGNKNMAMKELEEDKVIIKQYIDKYGEEWRKLGEDYVRREL